MSKLGEWAFFNSFAGGERSDLPAHLIPDNAVLRGLNVVTDRLGRLAKRGPVQPYLRNAVNTQIQRVGIGSAVTGGVIPSSGFAVNGDEWRTFSLPTPPANKRSGSASGSYTFSNAATSINVDSSAIWGPAFSSFGLTVFPLSNSLTSVDPFVAFGNAVNDTIVHYSNASTITVDVNASTITATGFVPDANYVGAFIYVNNSTASPDKEYIGVITGISSTANTVSVYPNPRNAFSLAANATIRVTPFWSVGGKLYELGGSSFPSGSKFGCVHQNRVVLLASNTSTYNGTLFGDARATQRNEIWWSSFPGEPATAANTGGDGMLPLLLAGWPKSQQLTLDTAEIVAVVSLDANNLLVLCSDKTLMINGDLPTVIPSADVREGSFNVNTISADVGCIDADSVQKTPLGVMFAFRDGVYITDGSSFRNVMADKVQKKWNTYSRSANPDGNSVCGSAVIGDTHYVIFTENGPHFVCDMYNDFSWTEISIGDSNLSDVAPTFKQQLDLAGDPTGISALDNIAAAQLIASSYSGDRIVTTSRFYQSFSGDSLCIANVFRNDGTPEEPAYVQEPIPTPASNYNYNASALDIDSSGERIVMGYLSAYPSTVRELRIFSRTGTSWSLEQQISDPDAGGFAGRFAKSVAIAKDTSDTIIVGSGGLSKVRIFKLVGGVWVVDQTISVAETGFGNSVAISSDATTIAITGDLKTHIYRWDGSAFVADHTYTTPFSGLGNPLVSLSHSGNTIAMCENSQAGVLYAFKGTSWPASTQTAAALIGDGISVSDDSLVCHQIGDKWYYYKKDNSGSFAFTDGITPPSAMYYGNVAISPNGKRFFASTYYYNATGHVYAYNFPYSPVSYGVGVRDSSGSDEVYAPLVGDSLTSITSGSAIVLLDSILLTDLAIETNALGFSQLIDAGTDEPFNATIETKSFTVGDPATLKAYKTTTFTYASDGTFGIDEPISVYNAQGLDPQFDYTATPLSFFPSTTSINDSESKRVSFLPRPIDNGMSVGFKTNFDNDDVTWKSSLGRFILYDIALNVVGLRRGRTIQ